MQIEKPQFSFSVVSEEANSEITSTFHADSWPVVLAQFIKFMRGAGYVIFEDKILINDNGKGEIPAEEYAQDFE